MLPDAWYSRDLPVLEACVRLADENPGIGGRVGDIMGMTGFDEATVSASTRALEDAGYIRRHVMSPGRATRVDAVSGAARAAVGQWPSPESAAERLVVTLEAQIAATTNPEERGRLERLLQGVTGVARDVLVDVLAKAITG